MDTTVVLGLQSVPSGHEIQCPSTVRVLLTLPASEEFAAASTQSCARKCVWVRGTAWIHTSMDGGGRGGRRSKGNANKTARYTRVSYLA
jgi:hypothetical protein